MSSCHQDDEYDDDHDADHYDHDAHDDHDDDDDHDKWNAFENNSFENKCFWKCIYFF